MRQALEEAVPTSRGWTSREVAEPEPIGGVPLPMLARCPAMATVRQPSWFALEPAPAPEQLVDAEVAGVPLVVANVEGTLLAYRDRCAGCGAPLRGGDLSAGALTCPGCRRSFFLPRAGRSLDDDGLQLDPVPLLRDGEAVRVALSP